MILKALFERIPAVLCQGSWDTDIASIAMCSKEVTNNSLFICIKGCLLYTSPSPRDRQKSRMPSSA